MCNTFKQIESNMKTAIVFISKHGTTHTVADQIAQKLQDKGITLIDLAKEKAVHIDTYDRLILGGSIHMGQVHKKTKAFIDQHHTDLLKKDLGLFLCCMEEGEKAQEQFILAFPSELREHAKSTGLMGYEYLLEKMGFLEKIMVKKITGKDKSFSNINEKAIDEFVANFNN